MFKYIRYKKTFFSGFLFKTFEVVLELFLPILMGLLMDKGLKENNVSFGLVLVGAILSVAILGYLTTLYAQYAAAKVGQGLAYDLRNSIFNHVIDLELEETNTLSSASFVNTMNMDVNNLQQSLSMTIRLASRAPVLMIGSIIALWFLSPKISLVLIIGLPILIVILTFVMYSSIVVFKRFQIKNDNVVDIVRDNVEGVRMIRSFAQSNHEQKRFGNNNESLEKTLLKLGRVTSVSSPFTMLFLNILLIIMIYLGVININNNVMSDSELLQIINYTTMLTISIIGVMNLILIYTRGFASYKRVKDVLIKEAIVVNKEDGVIFNSDEFNLEFINVSFSYESSGLILDNISFKLEDRETLGIVGLTGSGKSTLLKLILRFYDVDSGEILINGINVKDYDIKSLRSSISYQEQRPMLLSGTVKDNIVMGDNLSDDLINESLKKSEASFVLEKDGGINSLVKRSGSNFSGGQRQRIALSRALAKKSKLLILDDTFSALDYLTDYNIRTNLNEDSDKTKIFVSQRLSSLYNANKILVLNNKKIENIGTHEELLKLNKLYLSMYNTQILGGDLSD